MGKELQFERCTDFSTLIGENKIIYSSIGPNGEAVILTVSPEYEKDPFHRKTEKGGIFPLSKSKRHYPATAIRVSSAGEIQKVELAEVELGFPSVQPLPNGEILLVGGRCEYRNGDPEKNAVVFGSDGKVRRRFVLGDGIQSVQTTSDGLIWVSYFDEGVFGNRGWDRPMGAPRLICFDSNGKIVWQFEPPAGFDIICDCYALNVANDAVWACYYTEFPLVRVDSEKKVQGWKNSIGGASALAVHDERVLLWGGYGGSRNRCIVQNIGEESLTAGRELDLVLPGGVELKGATIIGRDSELHAFAGNAWFIFDLKRAMD